MSSSILADEYKKDKTSAEVFKPPESVARRFDVLELLSKNDNGETYLLAGKEDGKKFVLKTFKKSETATEPREAEILRELNHKGLPRFDSEIEDSDTLYTLREHAEGVPLSQYMESAGGKLNAASAIGIAMQLCDVLTYLHTQPSPIIHRDVKPSNIIINPDDNSARLIDFGISRRYSKDAASDTTYYGTKEFSPPEQFGYAQTDSRTDIYALGVVLRYMLTGSLDGKTDDKHLARVIGKCTAFSPDDRYKSAAAVKKDLERCGKGKGYRIFRWVAAVVVICAIIVAGIYAADHTDLFSAANKEINEAVVFAEPFIEQVVRQILEKDENEPIYPDELGMIGELILYEEELIKHVYRGDNPGFWFVNDETETSRDIYFGTLSSLDDLPLFYNLRELTLMGQPVRDISPLAQCNRLRRVELYSAPVSDAKPLTQLELIEFLTISDCNITDWSFLSEMDSLRTLWIENMPLSDISEIEALNITNLSVQSTNISILEGFDKFKHLEILDISATIIKDFSPLNSMPSVKKLRMTDDMERYLHTLTREDIEIESWAGE